MLPEGAHNADLLDAAAPQSRESDSRWRRRPEAPLGVPLWARALPFGKLHDYRYYHSARAEMLRRFGRRDTARAACARALELTHPGPEQLFLQRRLAALSRSDDQCSDR